MVPHLGKLKSSRPPVYAIDLNLPPKQRWQHIAKDFKYELIQFITLVEFNLKVPYYILQGVAYWGKHHFKYQEYVLEIEGIAETIGIPFDRVFVLQFLFEFSRLIQCSGVLVRNADNVILHGRNYDFEFWGMQSKLVAQVDFYKGSNYIYTSDAIVGAAFLLTGSKKGKFSMNINARHDHNQTFLQIMTNLFWKNHIPTDFLFRKTLEEAESYDQAVKMLNETNVTVSCYYIISGLSGNEGAVIEKQGEGVHGFYTLNDTNWFLVQTNYDRDVPDPEKDRRRIPAEERLTKLGQNITMIDVYNKIMLQWPTMNIATIYTTSMVAANKYFNTSLWYGANDKSTENQNKDKLDQLF